MKQAYRAKSGIVYYLCSTDGDTVTLRNPMTGEVKTIRDTTLARSYTLLTEEELKMSNATENTTEQAVVVSYKELLDCKIKGEFIEKLDAVDLSGVEIGEEITACEDFAIAKKAYGNAALCFKENVDRFVNAVPDYEATKADLEAHPEDLDIVKSFQLIEKAMQRYSDKMVFHFAKMVAAKERMDALKPAEEAPAEPATAE